MAQYFQIIDKKTQKHIINNVMCLQFSSIEECKQYALASPGEYRVEETNLYGNPSNPTCISVIIADLKL